MKSSIKSADENEGEHSVNHEADIHRKRTRAESESMDQWDHTSNEIKNLYSSKWLDKALHLRC